MKAVSLNGSSIAAAYWIRQTLALVIALAISGCDNFPKDVAGTMQEVTARGSLRVGIVADGETEARERFLAQTIAQAAAVEAEVESGSAEILLHRLENGRIDLVVGQFAKASPWKGRVAFTKPAEADSPPSHEPVLRAAVRSGENRWLIFVTTALDGSA